MRIEAYFQRVREQIESCIGLQLSEITCEKRGTYEGVVRAELTFVDGSILHIREFVDAEGPVERLMYVYQYMNANKELIFRYDNTGHHRKLNLSTYPHHKHAGREDNVITSAAPDLAQVLVEIQKQIKLP